MSTEHEGLKRVYKSLGNYSKSKQSQISKTKDQAKNPKPKKKKMKDVETGQFDEIDYTDIETAYFDPMNQNVLLPESLRGLN
jgi:hypothetical protein